RRHRGQRPRPPPRQTDTKGPPMTTKQQKPLHLTETDALTQRVAVAAARRYLEAWDRQHGRAVPLGCGLTWNSNVLSKIALTLGYRELPDTTPDMWWGRRWLIFAEHILDEAEAAGA